jgi:hypothetical protein
MAWYDDVKTESIVGLGVISIVVTFVTIVVVQGLAYQMTAYEQSRKAEMAGESSGQKIIEQQNLQIKNYAWVDKNAGTAAIPIDLAKNLVLKDLSGKK